MLSIAQEKLMNGMSKQMLSKGGAIVEKIDPTHQAIPGNRANMKHGHD
jgi:hypothetical protein